MLQFHSKDRDDYSGQRMDRLKTSIGTDHYASSLNEDTKFPTVNYANDNRFSSVSSEPVDQGELNRTLVNFNASGFTSFLGSAYHRSKELAGSLSQRLSEMELGSKIVHTSGRTYEVVKYAGGKVYEKGHEFSVSLFLFQRSDTARRLAETAGSGFAYLKSKVWGSGYSNSNSVSSDNYYQRQSGVDESYQTGSDYEQLGDNKNENLLDRAYSGY